MLVLDDTIVDVALPSIQRSLQLATAHLNWVISFYALAFGGLLLAGGRAGDLFGRRRVFRFGIIVFALASMAGGFDPNGTVLIAARLVPGLRCRHRGPRRAVPADHHLPSRAGQDAGHSACMARWRGAWLRRGPAARRGADRLPELALGAVHQRSHRRCRAYRHRPARARRAALTDGYVAGLLAGCVIFAVGALVALVTINARVSPAETAGH